MATKSGFIKNYVVSAQHGNVTALYLFSLFTKRQIMKYIAEHNMIGEALDSITVKECESAKDGVIFLGTYTECPPEE